MSILVEYNLLVLLLALGAAAVLALLLLLAIRGGRTERVAPIALGMIALAAGYATLLVAASLGSSERVLSPGSDKRFCGPYLDCHLAVAVERSDTASIIETTGGSATAAGLYHIVTLRISSDAKRAALALERPDVVVIDAAGRRYERARTAEQLLAARPGTVAAPLDTPVVAGAAYTHTVIFDLPLSVRAPRLHVTEGSIVERLLERFLIGDEDSFGHAPVLHALTMRVDGT